jgi:AraC-like DNA-binding protein
MTATPPVLAVAPNPLSRALEQLRLDGAIFFRAELTESWEFHSPLREMTDAIRPGAERLILFHIVAAGRCWVSLDDGDRHWAGRGDVIVLPYGDNYRMGGVEPAEAVPILTLLAPPPWASLPVLSHGEGGERTAVVCGYLHSEDALFDPKMRAFPPVFVVRLPEGPAASWVQASIDYALSITGRELPVEPISTRLPELLLIEVLREHLATAPVVEHGWVAALRDPVLAPAMARMHESPAHKWTVAELAAAAAVSRSVLDERFRQALGRSPMRYPRVADARGPRPAGDHRRGRRDDREARRLSVGGGVQPGLQAIDRQPARRLAGCAVDLNARRVVCAVWTGSAEERCRRQQLRVREVLAPLVRVGQADAAVGPDDELLHGPPRVVDQRLAEGTTRGLELDPDLERVPPELGRRIGQHALDVPVADAVGAVRLVIGVAQHHARQFVLGSVRSGASRLALTDDDGPQPGGEVEVQLGLESSGTVEAASAPEVPPEHDQRRLAVPELRHRAFHPVVIEQDEIRRLRPRVQHRPFRFRRPGRPAAQPLDLGGAGQFRRGQFSVR